MAHTPPRLSRAHELCTKPLSNAVPTGSPPFQTLPSRATPRCTVLSRHPRRLVPGSDPCEPAKPLPDGYLQPLPPAHPSRFCELQHRHASRLLPHYKQRLTLARLPPQSGVAKTKLPLAQYSSRSAFLGGLAGQPAKAMYSHQTHFATNATVRHFERQYNSIKKHDKICLV